MVKGKTSGHNTFAGIMNSNLMSMHTDQWEWSHPTSTSKLISLAQHCLLGTATSVAIMLILILANTLARMAVAHTLVPHPSNTYHNDTHILW